MNFSIRVLLSYPYKIEIAICYPTTPYISCKRSEEKKRVWFLLSAGNWLKILATCTLRFELSTLGEKRVKSGSESLKLPTAFKAAYFYILAGILLKNIIRTLSVY